MALTSEMFGTPEDVLQRKDEGRFELISGRLIAKPPSVLCSATVARAAGRVAEYLRKNPIAHGYIGQPCMGFNVPGDPSRVRRPEFVVVLNERAAADADDDDFFRIAPDIVVEVVAAAERFGNLTGRIRDFMAAGASLMWVINPVLREVTIRRPGRPTVVLSESDTLTASRSCRVSQ